MYLIFLLFCISFMFLYSVFLLTLCILSFFFLYVFCLSFTSLCSVLLLSFFVLYCFYLSVLCLSCIFFHSVFLTNFLSFTLSHHACTYVDCISFRKGSKTLFVVVAPLWEGKGKNSPRRTSLGWRLKSFMLLLLKTLLWMGQDISCQNINC
jgi:hypothetical protein